MSVFQIQRVAIFSPCPLFSIIVTELTVLYRGISKSFILVFTIVARSFARILLRTESYLTCCSLESNVSRIIFSAFFGMNTLSSFGSNWYVFSRRTTGLLGAGGCRFFFLARRCHARVAATIRKKVMPERLGVGSDFLDRELVDKVRLRRLKLPSSCLFLP